MRCMVLCLLMAVATLCAADEVDYREIGRRVWVNESDRQPHALVQWDEKQNCAQMGIGACLWYGTGRAGQEGELFPLFVAFAQAQGVDVPQVLQGVSPWMEAEEFTADDTGRKTQLHKWLAAHLDVQARFLIARAHAALPAMMRTSRKGKELEKSFEELAQTQQGLFCMADYLSFMGDGSTPETQQAGLARVLEQMRPGQQGGAPAEFSRAAAAVLQQYAKLPEVRKLFPNQLPVWLKRCRSYTVTH